MEGEKSYLTASLKALKVTLMGVCSNLMAYDSTFNVPPSNCNHFDFD
jgi:hypothetical protein